MAGRLALLALALAPLARAELVDRVAAVVNTDIITLSEVETRLGPELQRLNREPDPDKRRDARAQLTQKTLDTLIGEKLMEGQVKELGIETSEGEIDATIERVREENKMDAASFEAALAREGMPMTAYRALLRKQLARTKLLNLKVRQKVKLSDEELRSEYARLKREEASDFEVRARHLLVQLPPRPTPEEVARAKAKAEALALEARQPGVDFAELARKKSEGPSAPEGGDLGFFKRGTMVPEFDKAAFNTPLGMVSAPILTRFGWHVIKVEEHRAPEPRSFEEVKDLLRERLYRDQMDRYTDLYVKELRAQASVQVKL